MKNDRILRLCECAMMLALATVLSYVKLWRMPLGGSVTLCSMLPILLIAIRHGTKVGLATAGVYSLIQMAQAALSGDVFAYCNTFGVLVLCVLFDYLLPFTGLGLAAVFRRFSTARLPDVGLYAGVFLVFFFRLACHFVSGVVIWGQWAPDEMSPYVYSLLYNAGFLMPELGLTLVVAILLFSVPQMRALLHIEKKKIDADA